MSFAKSATLTIDHTKVGSGGVSNFAVPDILTHNNLRTVANGGFVESASGFDIRPFSDSGLSSALTFELVFYDPAAGTLVMYVLESSLSSSTDLVLYLGYGDASITTDGTSTSTWNANALLVTHYKDGTTLSAMDSTSNGINGTISTPTAAAGQVDGAASFNGTSDKISYGSPASLQFTTSSNFSLSFWMKVASSQSNILANPFAYAGAANTPAWYVGNDYSSGIWANDCIYFEYFDGTTFLSKRSPASSFSRNVWHHVVVEKDNTNTNAGILIFIDGVGQTTSSRAGTAPTFSINYTGLSFNAATRLVPSGQFFLNGLLNDLQVYNVLLTPAWVLTYYNATSSPGTFITASFATDVNAAVTGVAGTGSPGTLTLTGTANITPAGVAASGSPGVLAVEVDESVSLTGIAAAGSAGSLTVISGVEADLTGVVATSSPGSLSITAGTNVSLAGRSGTSHAGSLFIPQSTNVNLQGVSAFGQSGVLFNSIIPDLLCCEGPYRLLSIFDARIPLPPPPLCSFADSFVRANGQVNLGQPLWNNKGAAYPSIYSDSLLLTGAGIVGYAAFVDVCPTNRAYAKMTLHHQAFSPGHGPNFQATSGIVVFQTGIFVNPGPTNHMYFYMLRTGADFTGWMWELDRIDNGALTTLYRQNLIGPILGDFELKAEEFLTHVDLNVYVNGVLQTTFTDSSGSRLPASTGYGMLGLSGDTFGEQYWRDFVCGEF